jgi:tRNA (guanosine-2'-O-)-methyltransferase
MPTERRISRIRSVLQNRQPDLTVVCENIYDPHNVSAMLRTCDAVGVTTVHLLYTQEPFPQLGKQSSASARKWLNIERHRDPEELKAALTAAGMRIFATALADDAISHTDVDWTRPSAVILGNEHRGVSDEALAIADGVVCIPMRGMIASLNVSVATAVILYEAARQREAAGMYPQADLDPEWFETELQRWLRKA